MSKSKKRTVITWSIVTLLCALFFIFQDRIFDMHYTKKTASKEELDFYKKREKLGAVTCMIARRADKHPSKEVLKLAKDNLETIKKASKDNYLLFDANYVVARCLYKLGEKKESVKYYKNALLYVKKHYKGKDHPHIQIILFSLARICKFTSNFEGAAKYYALCCDMTRRLYEKTDIAKVIRITTEAVVFFEKTAMVSLGLKYHKYLFDVLGDTEDISFAKANDRYGDILYMLGRNEKAKYHYENAIRIYDKLFGENNLKSAYAKIGCGNVMFNSGDFKKGLKYYEKGVDLVKKLNPNNPNSYLWLGYAFEKNNRLDESLENFKKYKKFVKKNTKRHVYLLSNLCRVFIKKGEYKKALEFAKKALELEIKFSNKSNRDLIVILYNIARCYLKESEFENLFKISKKIIQEEKLIFERYFVAGSNNYKKKLWEKRIFEARGFLLTSLLYKEFTPKDLVFIWENVAHSKNIASKNITFNKYPNEYRYLLDRLSRIASLRSYGNLDTTKLYKKLINEKRRLEEEYSLNSMPTLSKKTNIYDLQKVLKDRIFLDFVEFNNQKSQKKELGCFIISESQINFVNLGSTSKIIRVVKNIVDVIKKDIDFYRDTYLKFGGDETFKRLKSRESKIKKKLDLLGKIIWKPLKIITKYKAVMVSPDGFLHFLPFSILRENGKYLLKNRDFVYCISANSIFRQKSVKNKVFLGISNTNFDSKTFELLSMRDFGQIKLARKEIKISSAWFKNTHPDSKIKVISEAKKKNAIDALNEANWVHIVTHGFFNNNKYSSNPLLKSGLVFPNGYLTAEEISSIRLNNLNCAILSCCNTGMGHVEKSGFAGLKWAFEFSGAKNVIANIWKVFDDYHLAMVRNFYSSYDNEKIVYRSVNNAQREFIKAYPKLSHPLFWGYLICNGSLK